MNTGQYSHIEKMEKMTLWTFEKLGFKSTYKDNDFYLQEFKKKPAFYKSIISIDLEDKGKVLMFVLDKKTLGLKKFLCLMTL